MSNFQAFGCKCFAYTENLGKLDSKCTEGIYVGRDPESPAYLIYFPSSQSVRKVRNVRFVKENFPTQEVPLSVEIRDLREVSIVSRNQPCSVETPADPPTPDDPPIPANLPTETEGTENIDEPRYPTRERRKPARLDDYVVNSVEESFSHHCFYLSQGVSVPSIYQQATSSPRGEDWKKAMDEEIVSLEENHTFDLV